MRRPLIVGNWKMHGQQESVKARLRGLDSGLTSAVGQAQQAEVAVLAAFPHLALCQQLLASSPIAWGAQNVCSEAELEGAYTGEVSAAMLCDFGCTYVTVGHSERRQHYAETDEVVALKVKRALEAGLRPILCVGESLEQRECGQAEQILQKQLAQVLTLNHNCAAWADAVIAYEPVWAIGTGVTATPEIAAQAHAWIRSSLAQYSAELADRTRILYGGSVNAANAKGLMQQPEIDGALVGGASLQCDSFLEIIASCNP